MIHKYQIGDFVRPKFSSTLWYGIITQQTADIIEDNVYPSYGIKWINYDGYMPYMFEDEITAIKTN